jgi:hypothetical protein
LLTDTLSPQERQFPVAGPGNALLRLIRGQAKPLNKHRPWAAWQGTQDDAILQEKVLDG